MYTVHVTVKRVKPGRTPEGTALDYTYESDRRNPEFHLDNVRAAFTKPDDFAFEITVKDPS